MTLHRTHCVLAALAGLLALPLVACSSSAGAEKGEASTRPSAGHQQTTVTWHPQQQPSGHEGAVEGARANLTRYPGGAAYQFHARELTPGHAYTLWVTTINDPGACEAGPVRPPSPATCTRVH